MERPFNHKHLEDVKLPKDKLPLKDKGESSLERNEKYALGLRPDTTVSQKPASTWRTPPRSQQIRSFQCPQPEACPKVPGQVGS